MYTNSLQYSTVKKPIFRNLLVTRKVLQYVAHREWGNIRARASRRRNHFPFHVWLAQNWIGQRNYLAAKDCKKIAHSPQKLLIEKNCSQKLQWANLLWANIFSVSLLTENQFCSRRIMNCPSFYLQSKYGRITQFLSTHKLLKGKKICSQ